MSKRVTLSERVTNLERQTEVIADIAANLVAMLGALSAMVGSVRADVSKGMYDPQLQDIENDIKKLLKLVDETWPHLGPPAP
jgi:hypothetical protein